MFFRLFGDAFPAPTAGIRGVARCHVHGLDMRYDNKQITCSENFFRRNFFAKIEIEKLRKSKIENFENRKSRSKKMKIENFLLSKKRCVFDFFDFSIL